MGASDPPQRATQAGSTETPFETKRPHLPVFESTIGIVRPDAPGLRHSGPKEEEHHGRSSTRVRSG